MIDTKDLICPIMSRPLVVPAGSNCGVGSVSSFAIQVIQAPCLREKCAFWAVGDVLGDGTGSPGYCGLCAGGLG